MVVRGKKQRYLLGPILLAALSQVSCSSSSDSTPVFSPPPALVAGVSWAAPSQRDDGTVLLASEIAAYRIYYGTVSGDYQEQVDITDVSVLDYNFTGLAAGTYYAVITAVDTEGRESQYSTEIVVDL